MCELYPFNILYVLYVVMSIYFSSHMLSHKLYDGKFTFSPFGFSFRFFWLEITFPYVFLFTKVIEARIIIARFYTRVQDPHHRIPLFPLLPIDMTTRGAHDATSETTLRRESCMTPDMYFDRTSVKLKYTLGRFRDIRCSRLPFPRPRMNP